MQMCFVAISLLLNFPSTTIMIHLTFIWGGKVKDFGGKHWSRKQKIWKPIFVLFDPIFLFLYYIICCWSVDYFLFILFVFFIFRRMVQDYRVTQINLYGPVETFFLLTWGLELFALVIFSVFSNCYQSYMSVVCICADTRRIIYIYNPIESYLSVENCCCRWFAISKRSQFGLRLFSHLAN